MRLVDAYEVFTRFKIRKNSVRIIENPGEVFVIVTRQKLRFLFLRRKIKEEIEMRKPIGIRFHFLVEILNDKE